MGKFVYYIPREYSLTAADEAEISALKQSVAWLPFEEIEDSPVPFGRISYATVDNYLKTYGLQKSNFMLLTGIWGGAIVVSLDLVLGQDLKCLGLLSEELAFPFVLYPPQQFSNFLLA